MKLTIHVQLIMIFFFLIFIMNTNQIDFVKKKLEINFKKEKIEVTNYEKASQTHLPHLKKNANILLSHRPVSNDIDVGRLVT